MTHQQAKYNPTTIVTIGNVGFSPTSELLIYSPGLSLFSCKVAQNVPIYFYLSF